MDEPTQHWSVTVERNGEQVVCIESNCLSGRDISKEDERVIRNAAEHLLGFIGGSAAPDDPREKVVEAARKMEKLIDSNINSDSFVWTEDNLREWRSVWHDAKNALAALDKGNADV